MYAWSLSPLPDCIAPQVPLPGRPRSVVSPSVLYSTQYPFTGTSVMLPLRPEDGYSADVMIFGGQDIKATSNLNLQGCSESLRMTVSMPSDASPTYGFNGGWVTETMGSPRVMPDAVLLPNGVVIIMSGTMEGLAGDSASGGDSKAYYPNFYAEMYDPYAPVNQRWTSLARSNIARQYHSTAVLTTNGTILVSGCDRCAKVITNETFSPSPTSKAEYRQEIFFPPFVYDLVRKPRIKSVYPQIVGYGEEFFVKYTGVTDPNIEVR